GVALHYSHKTNFIFDYQPMLNNFRYLPAILEKAYHPMIQAQLRPDVILPMADLEPYKMIFSPFLAALDEPRGIEGKEGLRKRLRAWIKAGGTWIVGPLADVRTMAGVKFTHSPYGSLEEWAGVYCKYEIPGDPHEFGIRWNDGRESEGSVWYDGLELRGAEALATYTNGPLAGLAAVTKCTLGKGQIIMLGTMPQPEDLKALLLSIAKEAGVTPVADASENLVVIPREGSGIKGLVAIEVENRPATLTLPSPMTDLLTGKSRKGKVEVPAYGVMVLKA
ncbi:MAG TPA: beta-galactosidase trimerization domain-containing protein, partial [Armatimonadota bacterium]|nr:beta-galactosidase trimerization domain-containing protein [Armatimonadota bacterium]